MKKRQSKPSTSESAQAEGSDVVWLPTAYHPIRAHVAGPRKGIPVLGIHDKFDSEDWTCWELFQKPLADAGFRVVLVDMPGHGQSKKWDPSVSSELVVAEIIRALDVDKVHLLGQGWGGEVCVNTCIAHSNRVLSVTLSAPDLQEKHREMVERISAPVMLCWARNDSVTEIKHSTLITSSVE
eukprot:g12211.t1